VLGSASGIGAQLAKQLGEWDAKIGGQAAKQLCCW
jgi:hypothetical protein